MGTIDEAMEKRFQRERSARKQAEALLETKSGELYQSNENLKHLADNLENLVAERTRELVEMREQALAGSRTKSAFVANMSHELRTPISGIIGLAELIIEQSSTTDYRDLAAMILDAAEGLLSIVNQVLDLSKLEAKQWDSESSNFDLCQVVDHATTALSPLIGKKKLAYGAFIDPSVPRLMLGEAGRLRQLLTNLISNAVKFTERGSVIVNVAKVYEHDQDVTLRFEVVDTGVGFGVEDYPLVFDKFQQLESSQTSKHSGTGLGLSICKMMVELLGGEIGFDSILGEGSTFWFTLPMQSSPKVVPPVAPDIFVAGVVANDVQRAAINAQLGYLKIPSSVYSSTEEFLAWCQHDSPTGKCRIFLLIDADTLSNSEHLLKTIVSDLAPNECERVCVACENADSNSHDNIGCSFLTLPVTYKKLFTMVERKHFKSWSDETPAISCNNASSYRILLVEDSPALQLVAKAMLTKLGLQVQLATNGRDAVEAVRNGHFDLVLMDIQMPEMDGITATRHIRNLQAPEKAQIPVIALTAYAMKGDEQKFLEAGMNDYLTKPIRLDHLQRIFGHWLAEFNTDIEIAD